jgi:hypothetical protein
MLKFRLAIFGAIFIFLAATAHARTYKIDIILVAGPFGVTRSDAISMFGFTRDRFAEIGVNLKLRRVASAKPQGPIVDLSNWLLQGWYWQLKIYHSRTNGIYYAMLPPFIDNNLRYIAGQSDFICRVRHKPAIAVGNAQLSNQYGIPRYWQSAIVMTHELGHEFGARHNNEVTLMAPNASALQNPQLLKFDDIAYRQIHNCVKN